MLKEQLELLVKEFNSLKAKIKKKLEENKKTIKENSENEKVLETLLKEFQELSEQLE